MKKKVKKAVAPKKKKTAKGKVNLTAQTLQKAVDAGSKNEKKKAFQFLGYTIKEQKGWVVKEYPDGRIEKISKIQPVNRPSRLALD